MADERQRVDVGFTGGQVLALRLESEDATVTVDLSQIIYVRLDTERDRVGF